MSTVPISPPPKEPITEDYVSSNWELWFSLITKKLSELIFSIGSVTSKAEDYTATIKDSAIYVTSGAAGVDITLPSAALVSNKFYYIYKVDGGAGPLVILPDGTDTINGLTSKTITTQWNGVLVRKSSSTSWIATSLIGL